MPKRFLILLYALPGAVLLLALLAWTEPGATLPPLTTAGGYAVSFFDPTQKAADGQPLRPDPAELDRDLRLLAGITSRIRTYEASRLPELPALAAQHGLQLYLGVWLSRDLARNERELRAGALAARDGQVAALIVGNEVLLRKELSPSLLKLTLQRARLLAKVPVSTAEYAQTWLDHPDLADAVDFLTVHLLPYWQGVDIDEAVSHAIADLDRLRATFPDKPVVVGEVGWPSHGQRLGFAVPSPRHQARFVKAFAAAMRDQDRPEPWFWIEAFDQPWKLNSEGSVGPHWGHFDAQRQRKFAAAHALSHPPYWHRALAAVLLFAAVLRAAQALYPRWTVRQGLCFAWISAVVLVLIASALSERSAGAALWPLPFLILFALIVLRQVAEAIESLRERVPLRPPALPPRARVVLHVAAAAEAPAVLERSLSSMAAVSHVLQRVLVLNNVADASYSAAVARRCRELQIDFHWLPECPGHKAQALNWALDQSVDSDWIGILDADYRLDPHWIESLGHWLDDPTIDVIQLPQCHEAAADCWAQAQSDEYDSFFRLAMPARADGAALVMQGTMVLIRRHWLQQHRWDTTCIVEDAELGLRLSAAAARMVYLEQPMGWGLLPDCAAAWHRQRQRWAFGATQILRRHAGALFGPLRLSVTQRLHWFAGWLPWLGHALHLAFALAALLWSISAILLPKQIDLPGVDWLLPVFALLGVQTVAGLFALRQRVCASWIASLRCAWASAALGSTIALALWSGLWRRRRPFDATRTQSPNSPGYLRWPAALALLLLGSAITVGAVWQGPMLIAVLWCSLLILFALPYLATLSLRAR